MKVQFYLRFHTQFGQNLFICIHNAATKNDSQELAMKYINEEFWQADWTVELSRKETVTYNYILKDKDGEIIKEWGNDRVIIAPPSSIHGLVMIDTWNHAGEYENVFFTSPFQNILLDKRGAKSRHKIPPAVTHIFKVKAPLLHKNEVVCVLGSAGVLGKWSTDNPILLSKEGNWWIAKLDLSGEHLPVTYKYGVYNVKEKCFVKYENGNNRSLIASATENNLVIHHDGFIQLPNNTWKGAGVAIPVFSLRSDKSFGVGEFADIKLLADWAQKIRLKLIQILPVNDTTATHTWKDSYPYAGISAFALHPLYIRLEKVAGKKNAAVLKPYKKIHKELNALPAVDYEQVMKIKWQVLRQLYDLQRDECFAREDYRKFYEENNHWLIPYAAFCYFRDKYSTPDFQLWQSDAVYDKRYITKLLSSRSKAAREIAFYFFVQYHLHQQLQEASAYAHKQGIVLKGDIPIGIYRYSCDAWVNPQLYNMDMQAGAPPDSFATKGQNWGFPTYNWKQMQENGFAWWRQRFEQMSHYFDAFRIDHILGFFRIWSIPLHAIEGIMGRFVPAIPLNIEEFNQHDIDFNYFRFCKPYITDEILVRFFGEYEKRVRAEFIIQNNTGEYELEMAFQTQRQVADYFSTLQPTDENKAIRQGLFDLISNIIVLEEEHSAGDKFHFRIAMEQTASFQALDWDTKRKLKELYINYFFHRQDAYWQKEAMHKLPDLKAATNMLICGEDLGMVPHCVPGVMQQLGILSLEIQRMPKDMYSEFFEPARAPYLSVVTPSTHDMSTIRGWWEEDRAKTQRFYNLVLKEQGDAPHTCNGWINKEIVLEHLYSPAIWSIFQLQDILGISEKLRRPDPQEERINIPAISNYYWCYRMHLSLEQLMAEKDFNEELKGYILQSARG